MQFEGKTIVVIGGSSGIGLEIVKQLESEGATIYATSRKQSDELKDTSATFIELDINGEVSALDDLPDSIDGLVYCPGTINLKPFNRLKTEDFENDFRVNLLGAVKVIQSVHGKLKKSGHASVVMFSTVAVQQGLSFHASVASAKGAVEGLGRSLAAELAPQKIRVNVVAPSLTDTPLASNLLSTEEKRKASEKRHPLGSVGTPQELAAMAIFLLSEKSGWITGQVIHVDGGMSSIKSL